jgi:hypothetical protein
MEGPPTTEPVSPGTGREIIRQLGHIPIDLPQDILQDPNSIDRTIQALQTPITRTPYEIQRFFQTIPPPSNAPSEERQYVEPENPDSGTLYYKRCVDAIPQKWRQLLRAGEIDQVERIIRRGEGPVREIYRSWQRIPGVPGALLQVGRGPEMNEFAQILGQINMLLSTMEQNPTAEGAQQLEQLMQQAEEIYQDVNNHVLTRARQTLSEFRRRQEQPLEKGISPELAMELEQMEREFEPLQREYISPAEEPRERPTKRVEEEEYILPAEERRERPREPAEEEGEEEEGPVYGLPEIPYQEQHEITSEEEEQLSRSASELEGVRKQISPDPELTGAVTAVTRNATLENFFANRTIPAKTAVALLSAEKGLKDLRNNVRKLVRKTQNADQVWQAMKNTVEQMVTTSTDRAKQAIQQRFLAPNPPGLYSNMIAARQGENILNRTMNDLNKLIVGGLQEIFVGPEQPTSVPTPRSPFVKRMDIPMEVLSETEQRPTTLPAENGENDRQYIIDNPEQGLAQFQQSTDAITEVPVGRAEGWVHPRGGAGENWEKARWQNTQSSTNGGRGNPLLAPYSSNTVQRLHEFLTGEIRPLTEEEIFQFARGPLNDIYTRMQEPIVRTISQDGVSNGFTYAIEDVKKSGNYQLSAQDTWPVFLKNILRGGIEEMRIQILHVSNDDPKFQQWKRTDEYRRLTQQEVQNTVFVLCGSMPIGQEQLTPNMVVDAEMARSLLEEGTADDPRTKYIAINIDTGKLLGFLITKDYSIMKKVWETPGELPTYYALRVNGAASIEQGIGNMPAFKNYDAIKGANTDDRSRILQSLEIEFLCAKTPTYINTNKGRVYVTVLGKWTNQNGELVAKLLFPNGEVNIVDASTVKYEEGYTRFVGLALIIYALIDNVDKGYYGTIIQVVNVPKQIGLLTDNEVFQQGGEYQPDAPEAIQNSIVAQTDSDVASFYHKWLQYERSFGENDMDTSLGLLWFYDGGNIYTRLPGTGKVRVEEEGKRVEYYAKELGPNQEIMYRPYPTLPQLASYVGMLKIFTVE